MRHPLFHLLLPLILVCCLCGSCRRDTSVSPHLLQTEALMDSAPDSALNILNATDTNLLVTPADRALHTLLLTQARYKTDIPSTDTAPIQAAADYFHRHGDKRRQMTAEYLLGNLLISRADLPQAIPHLLEAEQLAISNQDWFTLGLIERNIASLYTQVFNYEMALIYSRNSVNAFLKSGDKEYWNYERCNLAIGLYNIGKMEQGRTLLDSVITLATEMDDNATILEALHGICIIKTGQSDWTGAIASYEDLARQDSSYIDLTDKQRLIIAYRNLGMTAQADSMLKSLEATNRNGILVSLHNIYASTGEYDKAYQALLRQHHNLDTLVFDISRQQVSKSVLSYKTLEVEKASSRTERLKAVLVASIIAALIIIAVIISYFAKRKKHLDHRFTSLMRNYDLLSLEIKENKQNTALWQAMFKKRFAILDSLLEEYYQTPTNKRTLQIAKKIEKTILDIQTDKAFSNQIFDEIDQYHNNLITDFKNFSPNYLTPKELSMFALLCAGLSNQAISIILSIDLSPLYVRKSRLKSKISKSGYPRTNEILDLLS